MSYVVKVNGVEIEVNSVQELSYLGVQLSNEPNGAPAGLKSVNGNGKYYVGLRAFKSKDSEKYETCIREIFNTTGSRQSVVDMVKSKFKCVITKACVSAVRTGKIGASIPA